MAQQDVAAIEWQSARTGRVTCGTTTCSMKSRKSAM